MPAPKSTEEEESTKGLPSAFKTWNQFYAFVITELFVLIALFYWFSEYFK